MNKTKKILSLLIIIILAFVILFVYLYSFNEAKKLAADQAVTNKNLADLEIARQKLDLENRRLSDLRGKSYMMQVSQSQYLKTKALVDQTNIFFKDADTLNPQVTLKTKNKTVADEINAKRLKINELLLTWAENNSLSLETDQALINQIKVALLYIQSYVKQLETIVSGLSTKDSGLSKEQIDSYKKIITGNVTEIAKIITAINQAEVISNKAGENAGGSNSNEVDKQIEVVKQVEDVVTKLENIINNIATTTASSSSQNGTSTASTTVPDTSTSTGTKVSRRPRIVNPEPAIIYQQNPAPYKDTGVDVDTAGQITPLQDW